MLLSKATYSAFRLYIFISVHMFPGNWTYNLLSCSRNARPLSHRNTDEPIEAFTVNPINSFQACNWSLERTECRTQVPWIQFPNFGQGCHSQVPWFQFPNFGQGCHSQVPWFQFPNFGQGCHSQVPWFQFPNFGQECHSQVPWIQFPNFGQESRDMSCLALRNCFDLSCRSCPWRLVWGSGEVEAVAERPCEVPWLLVMPRRSLRFQA